MCARDRVRADGPFAAPAFPLVLIFAGVVLLPFTFYLYVVHPAWTWMYMVDPDKIPGLAVVPLVFFHAGVLLAGYYAGARLVRAGRHGLAGYLSIGGGVLLLVGLAVTWGRIGRYGTYEEYWDGRAISLLEHKLAYVMAAMMLGGLVSIGFVVLELLRDSRRVRTR